MLNSYNNKLLKIIKMKIIFNAPIQRLFDIDRSTNLLDLGARFKPCWESTFQLKRNSFIIMLYGIGIRAKFIPAAN